MNQDDNSQTTAPQEEQMPEPEQLIVPFEDSSKDFFSGFFETIKLILFQPSRFFKDYKLDGSIGKPILFSIIIGWIAMAISMFWSWVLRESLFSLLQEHFPDIEGFDYDAVASGWASHSLSSAFFLVLTPLIIVVTLFIISGIYHLFLMMVKGANKNFETTFNVVAYGSVSRIVEILPFCGGLFSFLYGIILAIIGLTEAHRTDSWKAVVAVLGPLILCCICCFLIIFTAGATGFLATIQQ